jgi:putative DNA-invertase from lambdoid prophage Rac
MKAAIYLRVSTDKQTTENQLPDLARMALARGFAKADVAVYKETESGAKRRPVLEELVADAKRGAFKTVFVWALDRLGRGGALEALQLMGDLDRVGVGVVSAQESWLDTSKENPLRDVLVAFSATIAKMERTRLVERTKAGIARARVQGVRLGRPPKSAVAVRSAMALVEKGWSVRDAAEKWSIGASTLQDHLSKRSRSGGAR